MNAEEIQNIFNLIIATLPALISLFFTIFVKKLFEKLFNKVSNALEENKEVKELKAACQAVLAENAELKEIIKKSIAKISHIDESDVEV